MKIHRSAFNLFLLAALILAGCKSPQEKIDAKQSRQQKKQLTALRLYLESSGGDSSRTQTVPVLRTTPTLVTVEKDSFLDERDVARASLVDYLDGYVIQIQFNDHGTLVLDMVSAANKGKRIVILADFAEKRWLAAPVLSRRIADGILTFTPDATREETARIVRGLNNTATLIKKREGYLPSW